jgi:hypothetical protein
MSKDRLGPPIRSSLVLELEAQRTATLPADYVVRRATAADAGHVAKLMRPADREEMEALEGCPAFDVLRGWMTPPMSNPMAQRPTEARRVPAPRLLAIDDEPVVIYGIMPSAGWAGHATPWLATVSTMTHDALTTVMWLSRLQVDAWQRRWPILQAVCDARNDFHGQWLEWLDFVPQGRVEAFGAAGLPFDLYRRGRAMVAS